MSFHVTNCFQWCVECETQSAHGMIQNAGDDFTLELLMIGEFVFGQMLIRQFIVSEDLVVL